MTRQLTPQFPTGYADQSCVEAGLVRIIFELDGLVTFQADARTRSNLPIVKKYNSQTFICFA